MDKNERKDRTRGQVRLLQQLYKDLQSWEVTSVCAWLVAGVLLGLGTILFWIPCQEHGVEDRGMYLLMSFLMCMGLALYMSPYTIITEGRKQRSMMEKLQYLPVDRRSILHFQLKKLLRMTLVIGIIQLAGQCVAALSYGRLEIRNLLFPVILGMLAPGGLNALFLYRFRM